MTYSQGITQYNNKDYIKEEEKCCDAPNILRNRNGYDVCSNCGTTISRSITKNSRYFYYTDKARKTKQNERVYSPFGPRTIIKGNQDGKGNYLEPKYLIKYKRLSKINRGLINGLERNLYDALPKILAINEKLNVPPHISQEAFRIYLLAAKKKLALGRSIDGLIAASLLCALRRYQIPKTWQDILNFSQVEENVLLNCYKAITSLVLPDLNIRIKHIPTEKYITKFGIALGLSSKCQKFALDLIEKCKANRMDTSGRNPKGYSAAALYLSASHAGENKTQKETCIISQVSEVTLRARIREIKKYNIELFDN